MLSLVKELAAYKPDGIILDRCRYDDTGLQSDFQLERTASGSFVNNAVRRVVYNPDYSISLVR